MMGRNWRDNNVVKKPGSNIETLKQFSGLINSIKEIILGISTEPSSLHFWFYKSLSYQVFGQTKAWTPLTLTILRERIDNISNLNQEDIEQQINLYLLEMHNFYSKRLKSGKKSKFTFYDFIRFNLIKYMSKWVGHQILLSTGDHFAPDITKEIDYPAEDFTLLKLDLGWVMLKSNQGIWGFLSVRQKYLIYLRYNKGLTILEISDLVHRHRASVEKEFMEINQVLDIDGHYFNNKKALS